MALILVDSYSETNTDDFDWQSSANNIGDGETFSTSSSLPLYSSKFYLLKVGSPTGNIVSKIYNYSGTPGTNAIPSGAALATSDAISIATLTGSYQLIEFLFTGANAITLAATSKYVITVEYSGGDNSNKLQVGWDSSSPTRPGQNISLRLSSGTWFGGNSSQAVVFYVYGGTNLQTLTRTHTTNSLLRKVVVRTHTSDAMLRSSRTRTFTTDALKRARPTRTHTTDAYIRSTPAYTRTHTTNTLLRKVNLRTFTTNSLLRVIRTKTHTTDTLAHRLFTRTHTTNSLLLKRTTRTFTTDTFRRGRTTRSHTADAFKQKKITGTMFHTADAYLRPLFSNSVPQPYFARKQYPYSRPKAKPIIKGSE